MNGRQLTYYLTACILVLAQNNIPGLSQNTAQIRERQIDPINVKTSSNNVYDILKPIVKYIEQGDTESLSAWYDDRMYVGFSTNKVNDVSKQQGAKILENFFNDHKENRITVLHKASKGSLKAAILEMESGSQTFQIRIFLINRDGENFKIQKIQIIRQ